MKTFGSIGLGLAAALAWGVTAFGDEYVEEGVLQTITEEERAEVESPAWGGGNWRTWLEHRGEADGWEGDVDLKGWFGRKKAAKALSPKSASTMGKVVYGWLPYWATSAQMEQFQWDRLTHVAYFSYEVNSANGGCSGKHSWGSSIVQTAHNHGVKIHLTATLFGSSGNKALLQNWTSCTTLTTDLINTVKNAGGDGICIDFESVGSWTGATTNLTRFMTNLAVKAAAQGLETSIALPSIDWYTDFDVKSFEKVGIMCIIMGYDYHYSGSSVPGPVAPLMPSSRWGTQLNDDYSVRYYLGKMTNASHLYLAVPYYGRKWKASSTALGASSLGSSYSSSPVLSTCASSASSYGRKWDSDGSVPYFTYTDSAGAAWQCFYDDVESLGLKYDYINSKGLGGVGIWALSHEPGTAKFWNLLYEKFGPGTGGGGSSGGGGTVEDGSAMVTWNFSASEGWASQSSNFTGTTNVAGEAWSLNEARVYPSSTYGSATGDLWLDVPGSYAVTPAIKGVVATQVVLTVRAAANSNLSGRKVGVYYSTDGGSSWTKAGTVSATAYDSLTPSSVTVPSQGGGSNGVKFKLLDESSNQDTGTVLVYQMVVKGKDATTGTLKVTLTPSSAKWSLNGTTYSSGETITLAAGTYTVTFNALAGYDTPASQSVTIVAGGSKTVTAKYTEASNWTRTIEFASSDGWSARTDSFFAGTTNVAGEAWSARGLKVNPTINSQNNVGYATLDGTGDYLVTPVITGTITQMVGMIRAGANSNLDGRKLDVQYSTDGGSSWTTSATWAANNYSASVTHTKSCSISASGGVKLRFYDSGTTDTNKTTVVLHQIVLKGTKTVTAPSPGWIKATLTPDSAKWRVAGTNHGSGVTAKLEPGTYTVSFNSLSGYVAPSDQSVTVTSGKTNSITATYTVMPGALTVNLTPAEAAANAKWKLSGQSATHASGETVSLSPGSYTVTFNALSGFNAPADQSVTISANQGKEITGAYTEKPASLTVNLTPSTATWKVSGSSANHASGETVSLAAGTYTVTFNALDGYDAPEPVEVTLARGGSKTISKSYTGNGNWTKAYDFTLAEGWTERGSVQASLSTNVAGEAWSMAGVKIFPTYATNNETGYIVIEETGNWVQLPTFAGTVTQVSAKVRAGWTSDVTARKLTLQYDVGAGWVDWSTWACSSYSNVQSRSKSATVSGGSAGVKLRVVDSSTGDQSKSTVVLHAITVKGNSEAGSASTGTLTVTLTPDTATWKVGGTTYASGATATLTAGNHTVSFNALSNYDAPASTNVTVAADANKSVKATYAAHPGTVTATLTPSAAASAGAKWKINGTTNASGASVSVPAGSYSVTYTAVDGYTTPSSQTVVVPAGGAARADAEYAVKAASLKVTLNPAGGTWKVAGTNFESGATAKLAPGTYTVSFNPQTGYATPESQSVTLAAGGSKTMTVTYPGLEGSVRYVLSPAEAVAAGAKWKINGTTNASGDTVVVPSGTYTVTFAAATGYAAPASETVVVDAEETVQRTAEYTEKPGNLTVTIKMNPSNDTALAAARWYADGESHAGGERVALPPGTHTVTFSAVAGYTAPAATNVTIESSKTYSRTVTYVGAPGNVSYALTPNTGSWKINGETYASGAVAEVPAGNYTVSFGALTGYTVPSNQAVIVTAGQTVNGTASYAVKQVSLTVKLTPSNATWNVNGTTHASGESVQVDPGTVMVSFNAVAGYVTPGATNVSINVGASSKTVNVAYEGLPGDVTYTLTPAEGTWKINGGTYESGDETSVPAGEYKVTFGALRGYTAPETQNVEVVADGVYRGTAEYTVKQVPLTVKLAPTNSLPDSARWSIVGIEGVYTNAEKVLLDPGNYTVTASDVAGWTTPNPSNVTINVGATSKSLTMTYKVAPGRITYTLTPSEATWKINNKTYASGETAEVTAGTYEVTFNALEGWTAPTAQSVTVAAGEEVSRSASYTALPATLTVTLTPATARWTVNGSSYASGATVELAAGTYSVSFGAVSGYVTPANQNVTLARGEARELSVEYVPEAVGVPVLQNATGVTTGAFDIAWSGVTGATKYVVQVAQSPDFDEEVLLECDFSGALSNGWAATAALQTNSTYAAGGKGAIQFKASGKWLMTPELDNAGTLTWHHATTSADEWSYDVLCATDTNFSDAITVTNVTVTQKIAAAVPLSVDLGGLSGVYVKWVDTRPSGSAQRFISGVTLTAALAAEKTTTGTSTAITGLEPGKTYYIRAKAETATGESDWSGVKTVQTSEAPATLTVTLTPAGGTWTVGGIMYANGATATLAAGTYRVTFAAADGYISPAAQNVTLASGEAKVLEVPCEPEPVGVPVLGAGSGITTGAFSIAWSGVTGATKYTVQVAESATFDDGVAVSASFEDGAMPAGWSTNKVTFANNKTAFSGDGKGVAIFAGSGHWLRTPKLSRPGVMGWSHAKNTGSAAGTAWSYVVECSDTEDFAAVTWTETVEVNDSVTTPAAEVADLTGQRNVYVRWRDTRATGTAQRYLSEIVILDALTAENTTTGTSAAFSGLAASTVYYVRVKATTATGDSDWSAPQTVTTADPPTAPAAPVLENATGITENGFAIGWNAPSGAEIYRVEVSTCETFDDVPILACDFTGDLPVGWAATGAATNDCALAVDNGSAWVFSSSSHYLRTAAVTNPATVTWYYATGSTNAWSYEVQASSTEDFASYQVVYTSPTITAKVNPTNVTADLRPAVRNLGSRFYLRWDDTRTSGSAKRYISGVSVNGALLVNETISSRTRTVTGLSAGTTYYVRMQAWGQGGWSGWSAVKSVTTSGGGEEEFDPYNPPTNPNLVRESNWEVGASFSNGVVQLDWDAMQGANGYIVFYSTNLNAGSVTNVWKPLYTNAVSGVSVMPEGITNDTPVFYRLRAW